MDKGVDIISLLICQIKAATIPPLPELERSHLFYMLLDRYGKLESESTRMDMMFRFDLGEKCLTAIRNSNTNRVNHYLNLIQAHPLNIDREEISIGMDAIYCLMIANKDHLDGNHEAAIDGLKKGMSNLNKLYYLGATEVVKVMFDLYMNQIRVYFRQGKFGEVIAIAIKLLDALNSNDGDPILRNISYGNILSDQQKLAFHCTMVDMILLKILSSGDEKLVDQFLHALSLKLKGWPSSDIKRGYLMWIALRSGDARETELFFEDEYFSLLKLPLSLRFIVISMFRVRYKHKVGVESDDFIAGYLKSLPIYKNINNYKWLVLNN